MSRISARHRWSVPAAADVIEQHGGAHFAAWLVRLKRLARIALHDPLRFGDDSHNVKRLLAAGDISRYGGLHDRHLRLLYPLNALLSCAVNFDGRSETGKFWDVWSLKRALRFAIASDGP